MRKRKVRLAYIACRAGECEATERGGGEAMASDADDGDVDAARRTAGVSDRQARAGVASAGKRQHQVPLIGIGQCHAMTASNQVNLYTYGKQSSKFLYTYSWLCHRRWRQATGV